jgi:hypothetical protein
MEMPRFITLPAGKTLDTSTQGDDIKAVRTNPFGYLKIGSGCRTLTTAFPRTAWDCIKARRLHAQVS